MTWYWLSFVDPDRPTGDKFLGACIVGPALSPLQAVQLAHATGCNPGGEVALMALPEGAEKKIPDKYRWKILSKEDCTAFDVEMAAQEYQSHGS